MTRLTIRTFLLVSLISISVAPSQVKQPESGRSLAKAQEQDTLSSPGIYPPDDPHETAPLNKHCLPLGVNVQKCARAIERLQLPQYPQVTGQNGEIKLSLKTGKMAVFTDRQKDPDDNEAPHYVFRDYLRGLGYFLIQALLYEDAGYYLVNDQTGEQFLLEIAANPSKPSPWNRSRQTPGEKGVCYA
jgi:hypothetical protein